MKKKTLKSYDVLIIPAMPAYNDYGYVVPIEAYNKADAIKQARRYKHTHVLYQRPDGKILYTATQGVYRD